MEHEQFLRTERLLGSDAVEALHEKTVTLVGLGAVGGYALEGLARLGVGHFRLVDFDTVSVTNINRQILATWDTVGQKKSVIAEQRVKSINPGCAVETFDLFLDKDNLSTVIDRKSDLTIDAIDSLSAKCDLLAYAYAHQYPIISSMGAALRKDPSRIKTGDLMETTGCPLARQVRQNLRKRGIGKGISVVYSDEEVNFTYKEVREDPDAENGRRVLGSLVTITGIFGLTLAQLALMRLLGKDCFSAL
jgi:tRNA A37 threonylcarbamoyladenosine dehydratase